MMGKEDKSEIGLLSEIGSLSKNKWIEFWLNKLGVLNKHISVEEILSLDILWTLEFLLPQKVNMNGNNLRILHCYNVTLLPHSSI